LLKLTFAKAQGSENYTLPSEKEWKRQQKSISTPVPQALDPYPVVRRCVNQGPSEANYANLELKTPNSTPPLSSNHPTNHILNPTLRLTLHHPKPHNPTTLTLNMLHQPTQHLILPPATQLRTTIQMLLMHRALDVVVQAVEGSELSGAEVAFVGLPVPGAFRGDGFDVRVAGESDHRAGDDVVAIECMDHVVNLLAIEAGGCACAGFEAAEEKVSVKVLLEQEGFARGVSRDTGRCTY
jgi:hypothetical protein